MSGPEWSCRSLFCSAALPVPSQSEINMPIRLRRCCVIVFFAALAYTVVFGDSKAAADEFNNVLTSFGNLSTVAGTALIDAGEVNGWTSAMEGGLGTNAELSRPHNTTADLGGNLYIADKDAHAIRLVVPDGQIFTIAGTNQPGFDGDGNALTHSLNQPNGIYTFPDGTSYIVDLGNSRIRKLANGTLTTIINDPQGISAGRGLWVSSDESLIYYASGSEIRRWTPTEGISTFATGFLELGNLTIDPFDGLLVATDRVGHQVYKVIPGDFKFPIAGTGLTDGGFSGQFATEVALNEVRGVEFDTTGGYYLATHRGSQVWYVDTEGIIHLLIDGDRGNDTHSGDGLPLTVPGEKISEPRAVTLGPDRQLLITENDGGYIRAVPRSRNILGDFDYDGMITAADADRLGQVIQVGVDPFLFNLNPLDSREVDYEDMRILIEDLAGSQLGDANLDGLVDEQDLAIWADHQFEPVTRWSLGDFNLDGLVDARDFNIWNANKAPGVVAIGVPEPASLVLFLPLVLLAGRKRRRYE
jgi:sugar lactone lactonase YvrE